MELVLETGIPEAATGGEDTEGVAVFHIEAQVLDKLAQAPHICLRVIEDGDEVFHKCYEVEESL